VVSSIQDIALAKIRESKTNPRRFFDEAKLAELADNIRQHGVLQPILLRPLPEGEAGTYELVAGARRYWASRLAKRESIRHTVGTLLAEMGEHQLTIRDYLRHSNLSVTNKYLQAASGTRRRAQAKLVEAILPVQLRVTTIADAIAP
jgi:ParB family chromosome partitioning protein